MADPPHYKGGWYTPPPSSSDTTRCSSCHNNLPLNTHHQQCPRCINRPNANAYPAYSAGGFNSQPVNAVGFTPSAPVFPPNSPNPPINSPVYHPHTDAYRPPSSSGPHLSHPSSSCPNCSLGEPGGCTSCSRTGHGREYRAPFPARTGPYTVGTKPYYWVDTFARGGGVPSTAIHGGHDIDGTQIFVGRAFHEGDWLPAKVIPEKNVAYVAHGGGEHAKDHYQVLCEQRFDWVPSAGGHVPSGAVEGGKTSDGESLYIGRVHHDGALTVGKVHPSHGVCYIPFDGREIGHSSYEILVLRS